MHVASRAAIVRSLTLLACALLVAQAGCATAPTAPSAPPGSRPLDDTGRAFYVTTQGRPEALQPFLLLLPKKSPRAAVVLLPGGEGSIGLRPSGEIERGGNFLVRSRKHFVQAGLAAAVLDVPSDRGGLTGFRLGEGHLADLGSVVRHLRERLGVPVWLVGTSRGTISVAAAAARLSGASAPDGLVLTASVTRKSKGESVLSSDLGAIRMPVLVVHHRKDGCRVTPFAGAEALLERLGGATARELIAIEAGGPPQGNPCRGAHYHGFTGEEAATVGRIAAWILAHPPQR